jgi:ComF family protein
VNRPQYRGVLCKECKKNFNLEGLLYFYSFKKSTVQRLIHVIKYKGVTRVIGALSTYIYTRYDATPYIMRPYRLSDRNKEDIVLTPLPLYARKKRMRGFNQAEILAEKLANEFGWQIDTRLLFKKRSTLTQTKLSKEERIENIANAFYLDGTIDSKKQYVLVDDVITTGATLAEASRELKNAGAKHVWAITIARG